MEKNIKVYNVNNIGIDLINEKIKNNNMQIIEQYFSEDNLKKQLRNLFNE